MEEQNPARWDHEETRQLVHAMFGYKQLALLRPAQRAVGYRLAHAEYHYREYRRIADGFIDSKLKAGGEIWRFMAPVTDDEADDLARFYVECEAHLYAFVQAVHAIADNLAHVVCYGLGLNLTDVFKGRVSFEAIESHVKAKARTESSLNTVANLLTDLKDSLTFSNLADLANQLKHNGGPNVRISVPIALGQSHEIEFSSFVRKGKHHHALKVEKFLLDSHGLVNKAMVETGIALNQWLKVNCIQKAKSPDDPTEAVAPTRNPRST